MNVMEEQGYSLLLLLILKEINPINTRIDYIGSHKIRFFEIKEIIEGFVILSPIRYSNRRLNDKNKINLHYWK